MQLAALLADLQLRHPEARRAGTSTTPRGEATAHEFAEQTIHVPIEAAQHVEGTIPAKHRWQPPLRAATARARLVQTLIRPVRITGLARLRESALLGPGAAVLLRLTS